MAHVPSNAPALAGTAHAVRPLPWRRALAVRMAEFAVLLLRGLAVILLLAPIWVPAILLMR